MKGIDVARRLKAGRGKNFFERPGPGARGKVACVLRQAPTAVGGLSSTIDPASRDQAQQPDRAATGEDNLGAIKQGPRIIPPGDDGAAGGNGTPP